MKKLLLLLGIFAFIWFGGFELRSMDVKAEEITIENVAQSSELQEGTETEPLAETETMPETYQVTGYAKWWDDKYQYGWADNTSLHPLCRIRVELIDGTDGKILGETYTTDIGYFNFQFTTDLEISTNQIYVKLYAESHNTMVVTTTGNYIGSVYSVESERKTFGLSNSLTFNVSVNMTTLTGQAFQVSQAVIMAAEYAGEMNGEAFPGVVVEYPHQRIYDGVEGAHVFFSAPSTICVTGIKKEPLIVSGKQDFYLQAYSSWDSIMHEYGHFVAYHLGIEDSPGGTHYMENNCIDLERWDELGVDAKEKGVKLAWSEGYATAFAIMGQQYFNGHTLNIKSVGDNDKSSWNIRERDYDLETNYGLLGEGHEYAVAVALYDLYDANNESGDTIFWGHQKLFDLIKY